ncbi:hypothetical protein [Amycolatopsis sp. NPDC054798]
MRNPACCGLGGDRLRRHAVGALFADTGEFACRNQLHVPSWTVQPTGDNNDTA